VDVTLDYDFILSASKARPLVGEQHAAPSGLYINDRSASLRASAPSDFGPYSDIHDMLGGFSDSAFS
jgi:hypothetical protein